ncbi:hypothetical protein JOQ06_012587, partial [Pogonophryne albipinna]
MAERRLSPQEKQETADIEPTGLHLTPSLPPSPRSCPLSLTRAPPQSQGVVSLPARLPDSPTSPLHPLRGDRLPIRNAAVATLPVPPPPPPPPSPTLIVTRVSDMFYIVKKWS